jgi:hypothetical protein
MSKYSECKTCHGLVANAIAISGAIHGDRRYHEFYDRVGDELNGFTGIYDKISELAEALTDWEQSHGDALNGEIYDAPGNPGDWVAVIDHIADQTITTGGRARLLRREARVEACRGQRTCASSLQVLRLRRCQTVVIEVAFCERCGGESLWRLACRAGIPICQKCGSADVSRCERPETKEEVARLVAIIEARKQS